MTVSTRPADDSSPETAEHLQLGEQRERRTRLFGLALFIVAETMIFVPVFAIRFLLAGTARPADLDDGFALVLTAVMVASFAAMHIARRAARRDRWPAAAAGLWAAAVLGLVTAVGSGIGWADPALDAASDFGGTFYLATGAHALHLVAGAAFVAGLAVQARRGRLAGGRTLLDVAYWFWAFLLVVWLAIEVIFYLM
ncbi:MAG TPA: cytochrome c oxidase subunit 3 [Jiangellaceae bacterium]